MKTIQLNTGNNIPNIGYGTWQIIFGTRKKVLKAIETGYRLIDTAKIYGNEVGVGAAVRESKIPRGEIFVTTKLWPGEMGHEKARRAFDDSLVRLGLDYIDLYLIHWPGNDGQKRMESWSAMEELYREESARAIGVSNFGVEHLEELFAYAKVKPAVNQIEFHPYIYADQKATLDFCKKHGIVVEAYSPLAHGRHVGEPLILEIAKKHNASSAQILLAWCLAHGTIPIPKSTDPGRMKENLDSVKINLSQDEVERINGLSRGESIITIRH